MATETNTQGSNEGSTKGSKEEGKLRSLRPETNIFDITANQFILYSGLSLFSVTAGIALLAPYIAPYGMNEGDVLNTLAAPSSDHLLGTDQNGRDVLSRIMFAYRNYLMIATAGIIGSFTIGASAGLIAGYYGGRVDDVMMRTTDALMAFPSLILGLALVAAVGPSREVLTLVIIIGFAPAFARMGRNTAISIREELYIKALKVKGVGNRRILFRHVLPNASTALGEQAMLRYGTMVIVIATLSFLGVGLQPPSPSLGLMISDGADRVSRAWWLSAFPAIALFLLVLGPTLIGQALMDKYDPRSQQ